MKPLKLCENFVFSFFVWEGIHDFYQVLKWVPGQNKLRVTIPGEAQVLIPISRRDSHKD